MITKENLKESLQNREIRDILSSYNHPNEFRNKNGFTYLDYVFWTIKVYHYPITKIIKDINDMLNKEGFYEQYSKG